MRGFADARGDCVKTKRLFVFDTLGEACRLWRAHVRLILIIALTLSTVEVLQTIIVQLGGEARWAQILGKALLGVASFILDAVKNAALIYAIINPGPLRWPEIRNSINRFGARLVGVHLLIGIIGGLAVAAVSCCVAYFRIFEAPKVVTLLAIALAIMWLIFLKYALADPLVVNENFFAMDALRRSWQMTRSHVTYVAANYIVVGIVFALAEYAYQYCLPQNWSAFLIAGIYSLAVNAFALVWITLAWCMYQRIKEADALPEPQSPPTP